MNLIEAVKTGWPFRRKAWGTCDSMWAHVEPDGKDGRPTLEWKDGDAFTCFAEDVLANDWEVLEPEVRITSSMFWAAVASIRKCYPESGYGAVVRVTAEELARQLGLERAP
jgi:hypothetical protein